MISGWTQAHATSNCTIQKAKFTWLLKDDVYYMLYDDNVSLEEARCVCNSLPDTRLAIFDQSYSLGDIGQFLSDYYPDDQFWVDAERDVSCKFVCLCVCVCVCMRVCVCCLLYTSPSPRD